MSLSDYNDFILIDLIAHFPKRNSCLFSLVDIYFFIYLNAILCLINSDI